MRVEVHESTKRIGIPVLIPSYKPDGALLDTVQKLQARGLEKIVIVDDGSGLATQAMFTSLGDMDGIDVIHHGENQGKGSALKTGLRFISEKYSDSSGIVTVDGDGQHLAEDVVRVALDGQMNSDALVLGVRSFSDKVPWRSRIGNELTKLVTRTIYRLNLTDTQTGLRFIPRSTWRSLLSLKGERYEFEMNCLLFMKGIGVPIREVPIETVYLKGNRSSHFRPLIDSFRVYAVFARFSIYGMLSFVIDMGSFLILSFLTNQVFLAAIVARCISGIFNFALNRNVVFGRDRTGKLEREALGYLLLWSAINLTSASLVSLVDHLVLVSIALAKLGIDATLFVVSFLVQHKIIFRGGR